MEEILHLWVALKYSTLTKTSGGLHGMQFGQMLEMISWVTGHGVSWYSRLDLVT